MPVITAKDLYKCYAGFAPVLKGASIDVEAGEMAAIMGPSGCGKSTMLHILGMLHAPDSGTLNILDTDVLALTNEQTAAFRRGNMGFVMQASNLFEHSTVFENVEFPLIYENVPPQERWERVIRALDLVRLSARVHYRSNRLSGGEQQRVAIARAMVNNPRILLADEPTGALDARTSVLIMENFRKLCHDGGVAMIMVTHDPKMADYCDSIYTLEEGRLVQKKHDTSPWKPGKGANFLNPPEPLARGSLVAGEFPGPWREHLPLFARRLHKSRMLSRIYALKGSWLGSTPPGYALPLPIRQASPLSALRACLAFLLLPGGAGRKAWRKLPKDRHSSLWRNIRAFAMAEPLRRWVLEDGIEFLYAANAGSCATTVWAAAEANKTPFAFSINPEDIPCAGPDWLTKANAANFASCPTNAVREALKRELPELPEDKILLLRPPLSFSPEEETPAQPEPGRPAAILSTGLSYSRAAWRLLLQSLEALAKTQFAMQISILDNKSWSAKRLARKCGLDKIMNFYGLPGTDGLAEIYRSCDIFIAAAPDWKGGELALPLPLCEAMACGLAVIAVDPSQGMLEVLRGNENCIAMSSAEPAKLAELIRGLAKEPEKRLALGKQAREDILALLDTAGQSRQLADRIAMASALEERAEEGKLKI